MGTRKGVSAVSVATSVFSEALLSFTIAFSAEATLTKRKRELYVDAPKIDLKEDPETVVYVSVFTRKKNYFCT